MSRSFKNSTLLLAIIGAVVIASSIVSYNYYAAASRYVSDSATEEIRSNTRIQAHDLAISLDNKISSLTDNLQILAGSRGIIQGNVERGAFLLAAAHKSTEDLTEGYFWLDKNGILLWSSNLDGDPSRAEEYRNFDLSYREYFTEAKTTLKPYYSGSTEAVEGAPTLFISHPVISQDGGFQGVVAVGVRTDVLGNTLAGELSPEMQGSVGLIDKTGIVLYTSDTAQIGKQVFDEDYQSYLKGMFTGQQVEKLGTFVSESMLDREIGSQDFDVADGKKITLAFSPVFVESQRVGTLYVATPHVFPASVTSVIGQQQFVSMIQIVIVAAVAIGIAYVIISWNKNLARTVKDKTFKLEESNTNLVRSYKRLEQSERLQKEFVNVAAHELRTPIQPLLGMADILESQFKDDRDEIVISKPEVDMIVRNAKRLERLSSDILQVSRIESNSLILHKEMTDLNMKIKNIIEDTQRTIPKDKPLNIVFEQVLTDGSYDNAVMAEIDNAKFFEVLSNLLSNAIKFTDEGTITVALGKSGDEVVVSVRDTGSGIDPEMMTKLFSKFATNSESGTGLGLFISRSIVKAHGGMIWAENNKDGHGATFTFTIPVNISVADKPSEPES